MVTEYDLEVDRNYDAFVAHLPTLLNEHRDKFALMRAGAIVGFHESSGAALAVGHKTFGETPFSIQEITDRPVDLGFFSHAIDTRIA
jgi:hypothetical protein